MSGPRLPSTPLYVSDCLGATRQFTLAERGAYSDLLFLPWNIGPLPNDPRRLASLIGCTAREFAAVWPAIHDKFANTPAGLVNERLEAHRVRTTAAVKAKREGARLTNEYLAQKRRAAGAGYDA